MSEESSVGIMRMRYSMPTELEEQVSKQTAGSNKRATIQRSQEARHEKADRERRKKEKRLKKQLRCAQRRESVRKDGSKQF